MDRKSDHALQAKLESIDAAIAAHPYSSERFKGANAVIAATGKDGKDLVERELAENDPPGLEELGKIQLRGTASWWKLHRERNKVAKKIERLTA